MNTKMSKLALAIGALVMAGGAMAATEAANLTVNATVENACAIGPGTLAFGTIALDVQANGTLGTTLVNGDSSAATMSIICTVGASATITADNGLNFGATRFMKTSGTDTLGYALYTTAARDVPFSGATTIDYTGTGAATTTNLIYGQITQAQLALAPKGVYSDTVGLTITYTP